VCGIFVYRWFDSGEEDGLIERELDVVHYVQTPPPATPVKDEPGYFCNFFSCNVINA